MSDKSDALAVLQAYDTFESVWQGKSLTFTGYIRAMTNSDNAEVRSHGQSLKDLFEHPLYGITNEFNAARRLYKLEEIRKRLAE